MMSRILGLSKYTVACQPFKERRAKYVGDYGCQLRYKQPSSYSCVRFLQAAVAAGGDSRLSQLAPRRRWRNTSMPKGKIISETELTLKPN